MGYKTRVLFFFSLKVFEGPEVLRIIEVIKVKEVIRLIEVIKVISLE